MTANEGVSNCYVFKSRLQEYAQKLGFKTPVYETIKEGPSHEPFFRSTVIVNDARYDSLTGFFNRKAAEQSAAEVALIELAKSVEDEEGISVPIHETGLCKNLLQEYAQKMNYAIPLYGCRKEDAPGRMALFSCTVEIGGMKYIGAAARNKKEAEIKAARTALLAIKLSSSGPTGLDGNNSQLTVLPGKKREVESVEKSVETPSVLKPKKARFKKKKTRGPRGEATNKLLPEGAGIPGSDITPLVALAMDQTVPTGIQDEVTDVDPSGGDVSVVKDDAQLGEVGVANVSPSGGDVSAMEDVAELGMESVMKPEVEVSNVNPDTTLIPHANGELQPLSAQPLASNDDQINHGNLNGQTPPMPCEDLNNPDAKYADEEMAIGDTVKGQVAAEAPSAMTGIEADVEASNVNPDATLIPHTNVELQPLNAQPLASNDDQSNHENPNGQTSDLSNPAIHEDANNIGESVEPKDDQINHGNLNGQTPPTPCEDLNNPDAKYADEEMAVGDTVKGQVAAEASSAMTGIEADLE